MGKVNNERGERDEREQEDSDRGTAVRLGSFDAWTTRT
jgi:hypothetical protein